MRFKLALLFGAIALGSCSTSPQDEFVGSRIPDSCGANWPVCDTFAGCRLDNGSYVKGNLPGKSQFIVHTLGPAHIDVALLVDNAEAQGTDTSITFFEPGCGVQYRIDADGKTFFAESQNEAGTPFKRGQDVSQGGDHLIILDSDATCTYLLDVTVTEQNPTTQQ
ncbi:MAG: hypothetical protein JST54_28705 [Deltaproteobacteria bacterium]|nr:hypothetical protein [Deltaproteobacteria bacterium]